ncbi:FkbM family methyltransferase [bacterium C-53]|nr:FkbM family methyltransferase [Lachnospiraceae bacterium]NBI02667.1 FkbM family methyltransferase [Lachnospiraceae bacterium]RKJ11305.1 FkbM family methyltransferase [bacterium C-53]
MTQHTIQVLRETKLALYIWGAGEVAETITEALKRENISIDGYVVDSPYIKENEISKENLLASGVEYNLVRGFLSAFFMTDEEVKENWPGCKNVITIADSYEPLMVERMPEIYYKQNKSAFNKVRTCFKDNLSKESFDEFIDAKITGINTRIIPLVEKAQYFFENAPWKYEKTDVLIDGGAYDGDSILNFIKLRGADYTQIIACEPDKTNYKSLLRNIQDNHIENIQTINKGLYREPTILKFASSGTRMSSIDGLGEEEIVVDTIDNIAGEWDVSIIKMDIEGSEIDALNGAIDTIQRCRPILMISAYHKKDDILKIFDFVNKNAEGYEFFFRCHKPIAIDAVLYAVPKERVK